MRNIKHKITDENVSQMHNPFRKALHMENQS